MTDGRIPATTTVEVIQELAHVRTRRWERSGSAELAQSLATVLSPLILATEADLADGLAIFAAVPSVGSFDAVLAAATRNRGMKLVTADRGFAAVPGLGVLALGGAALAALLDG